jgi:hypothetical protein
MSDLEKTSALVEDGAHYESHRMRDGIIRLQKFLS